MYMYPSVNSYLQARQDLEVAHTNFERALNESRKSSFKNFVRDFKKGVAQIGLGKEDYNT